MGNAEEELRVLDIINYIERYSGTAPRTYQGSPGHLVHSGYSVCVSRCIVQRVHATTKLAIDGDQLERWIDSSRNLVYKE